MSQFIPEDQATSSIVDANAKGIIPDGDLTLIRKVLARPEVISQVAPNFFAYMVDYLAVNQPLVPIGQISGFSQFTARAAQGPGSAEYGTSATYDDLATVGPQLTNLPDGNYVIGFGAIATSSVANKTAYTSISINGASATDSDGFNTLGLNGSTNVGGTMFLVKRLSASGNNSLCLKYRTEDASYWQNRWLLALKYANA